MVINRLKVHVIGGFSYAEWKNVDSVFGTARVHLGMYERVYEMWPDEMALDVLERAQVYLERATVIAAWADDGEEIGANVVCRGKQCGALILPYPKYDWDEADDNPEYMDLVMYKLNERVEWVFQAAQQMWAMAKSDPA